MLLIYRNVCIINVTRQTSLEKLLGYFDCMAVESWKNYEGQLNEKNSFSNFAWTEWILMKNILNWIDYFD